MTLILELGDDWEVAFVEVSRLARTTACLELREELKSGLFLLAGLLDGTWKDCHMLGRHQGSLARSVCQREASLALGGLSVQSRCRLSP